MADEMLEGMITASARRRKKEGNFHPEKRIL